MKQKTKIAIVITSVILLALVAVPVFAGSTAGVNVTVQAQNISITVSPTSYDYGVLSVGDTTETATTFTATNNGNIAEDFYIQGANTTNWTLANNPGDEIYEHDFKGGSQATYKALTTSDQAAASNIAAGGSVTNYRFQLHMPTSTTNFDPQSTTVTFTATAH